MDEYLNSNTKPSEEVSAFGERDASYINEAAQRLRRSGDVVVIESPNHALRDHYVKQILSLSFLHHPGLTVHRCKKERDSMVNRMNQVLNAKTSASADKRNFNPSEIWLLDLQGSEDFDLLKLAQTLVGQFGEAGICMLVSCSSVIADNPRFKRWSSRLGIPVWRFELPDTKAMKAFLAQESRMGAVNQARLLVNELESLDTLSPDASQDETSSKSTAEEAVNDIMNSISQFNTGSSIPKKVYEEPDFIINPKDLKEYQDQLIAEALEGSEDSVKPDPKSVGVKLEEPSLYKMFLPIGFGFIIVIFAALALINDSEFDWFEKAAGDLSAFVNQKTKSLFSEGKYRQATISQNETPEFTSGEKNESGSENLVSPEYPEEIIKISKLEQEPKVVEATADRMDLERAPSILIQPERTEEDSASNSQIEGAAEESEVLVLKEAEVEPLVSAIRASDYYAQLGAFSTEESAQVWQKIRVNYLPETLVVQKRKGLWAVVSGPYSSRETAKQAFVGIEIEPYMVRGSDLKIEMDQFRGRL